MEPGSDIVNEASGLKPNMSWVLCKMNAAIKRFLMTYWFIPESRREKFLIINTETRNCTMCRQCETLEQSPASGLSVLHHSLQDERTYAKSKEKNYKSKRQLWNPRKQHFPDTGGLMYIRTQREHDSMHRTYTNSSQAKPQHE